MMKKVVLENLKITYDGIDIIYTLPFCEFYTIRTLNRYLSKDDRYTPL